MTIVGRIITGAAALLTAPQAPTDLATYGQPRSSGLSLDADTFFLNEMPPAWAAARPDLPKPRPTREYANIRAWYDEHGRQWVSQIGQDRLIVDLLQGARDGVFLDVGANDGVTLSNSYILERDYGWRGICVEPMKSIVDILDRVRPECARFMAAAYHTDGETRTFVEVLDGYHMLSGVQESIPDVQIERLGEWIPSGPRNESYPVGTARISTMLDYHKLSIIDFMSLDVEGGELAALQGIDFSRHVVNIMAIEEIKHGSAETQAARVLIRDTGLYHEPPLVFGHDVVYLRKQPMWSWEMSPRQPAPVPGKYAYKSVEEVEAAAAAGGAAGGGQ